MGIIDDFADLMNDTVTIEPMTSRDTYGEPAFGPGVTYRCRIDGSTTQRVSIDGVERTVNAMIYLSGEPVIGPTDRLTMPAGFTPNQPPILRVNIFSDDVGPHHTEIAV